MSRVTIYNRNNGDPWHASLVSSRLSNSVVSLLNYQGATLKTYRIGDARDIHVFDINFAGESGVLITNAPTPAPTASPIVDATLVHKVRIKRSGSGYLHVREVQVYDYNNVNRALHKPTSQSSTYAQWWSTGNPYCGNYACTQAVWDTIAIGHSCGARIMWLQSGAGYTGPAACKKVESEYPTICTCAPTEFPPLLAVDGSMDTYSSTNFDNGKYHFSSHILDQSFIH